ncbi:protein kinase family protein [Nonomuraea candida]|uniref:protein kinase family protein n=1 Tax=Nonomuraea candida TaxID=359159 RepID=UPI00146FD307|nr:protein kinase [Nonomuraea candida]
MPGDPERLGGCWLAARLGAGGRGVVYDAYDDEGRRFAVTVPRGEVRSRFERVTCRHLAEVVSVGSDDGVPFVVSEFVAGPDLRQAVELHGPYSGDELVALAAALAVALDALHAAGLTHRGLNPESVLLADEGPKVIELGLPASPPVGGTCTYQAPEVLTGQGAEAAADVFAWGAVVLFAATGRDPFHGESLGAVLRRLLTFDPDLSCLPEPLGELVGRALAKDPAQRPAAGELRIDGAGELRPPPAYVRPKSLGELAEEVYLSLTPGQQEAVPGALLRLLDGESPHDEGDVLRPLMEAGLLVRRSVRVPSTETPVGKLVAVSDDRVVPASAALYRAWPRLRGWMADEREGMPAHRRIREAARHWSEHRRGRSHLLRGAELDSALGWAATKRRHLRLNQLERDFLNDSVALSKQRRKLLVPSLATVGAVLAVAVTMTVVSVHGQNDLRERLIEADARAVAARAEALRESDPRTAMRLSVAAWRLSPVFEARAALQNSLVQPELAVFTDPAADARARYLLRGDELVRWDAGAVTVYDVAAGRRTASYAMPVGSTALSEDGRHAEDAGGRPFDVATGQPPAEVVYTLARGNRTKVYRGTRVLFDVTDRKVALSPDGTRAALSRPDGRVELWELSPRRVRTGVVAVAPLTGPDAAAPALAFSPGGTTLAVAGRDGVTLVSARDRSGTRGDARGTRREAAPIPVATPSPGTGVLALASPSSTSAAPPQARATATPLPDATAPRTARPGGGEQAAVPAEGRAPEEGDASREGRAADRAWGVEVVDGMETPPGSAAGPLVFSPDGTLLALPGHGEVRVWNVAERRLAGSYPLKDPGHGLSFSADGRVLRYLSGTGTVVSLDVSGLPVPSDDGHAAAFSGNGRVAAEEIGNTIELTDTEERRKLGRIATAGDLAFDAAGRLLAVSGSPVTVWEVAGGRQVAAIEAGGDVPAVALSPDGRTLATARGGTLETWDVLTGRRLKTYEGAGDLALAFSPDGATLAAGAGLLDLATGRVTPLDPAGGAAPSGVSGETVPPGGDAPTALAFSPDGRRLALGLEGGRVLLVDVRERRTIGAVETGTAPVEELRFSPGGDLLAVDAARMSLWDTRALREVGKVTSWANGLAFSQDGTRLRGVAVDGTVREIAVDPALTAREVCARAGGPLSRAEWSRLIPESGYEEGC